MHLYSSPRNLPPRLDRARALWRSLIREPALLPFRDDLTQTDMGDIGDDAFTLDVFDKPERFRFALVAGRSGGWWRPGSGARLTSSVVGPEVRFPPVADRQTVRFRAGIKPSRGAPPKPPPDARGNALGRST